MFIYVKENDIFYFMKWTPEMIFGKKSVKIEKKNYVDMIGYTFDGSCLDYFEYYISCFVPDTSFYTYPDYEKMFDLKGISKFNYSQWNPTPIEKENQHYGMVQNLTHIGNLMNNKKTAKFVDDDLINNKGSYYSVMHHNKMGIVIFIYKLFYFYNFINPHSSLNNLTPAQVAGAEYSEKDKQNLLLAS